MAPPASRDSITVAVIAIVAVCVASVALVKAASWYGHPFPGVLITSDGNVSSIGMPTWSGVEQGLRFPDRALSIDGVDVAPAHGQYAARAWDGAVNDAAARALTAVHVRVATATGERELDLRLERLDAGQLVAIRRHAHLRRLPLRARRHHRADLEPAGATGADVREVRVDAWPDSRSRSSTRTPRARWSPSSMRRSPVYRSR